MAYYQKKQSQIKATQWFELGDHPGVSECDRDTYARLICIPEGHEAEVLGQKPWLSMGVCGSEGNHLVCPGDYVVTGIHGEIYPVKQSVFEESYDEIIPGTIEERVTMELKAFDSQHFTDDNGCPAGGHTQGTGFTIVWQNGALREELEQQPGILVGQNGAFVEDVIKACRDRLEYYQQSKFACQYNADAIAALNQAIEHLNARTAERESRGVEGRAIV